MIRFLLDTAATLKKLAGDETPRRSSANPSLSPGSKGKHRKRDRKTRTCLGCILMLLDARWGPFQSRPGIPVGLIRGHRALSNSKEHSVTLAKRDGVNVRTKRNLRNNLFQESASFFCKGPKSKCFGLFSDLMVSAAVLNLALVMSEQPQAICKPMGKAVCQ